MIQLEEPIANLTQQISSNLIGDQLETGGLSLEQQQAQFMTQNISETPLGHIVTGIGSLFNRTQTQTTSPQIPPPPIVQHHIINEPPNNSNEPLFTRLPEPSIEDLNPINDDNTPVEIGEDTDEEIDDPIPMKNIPDDGPDDNGPDGGGNGGNNNQNNENNKLKRNQQVQLPPSKVDDKQKEKTDDEPQKKNPFSWSNIVNEENFEKLEKTGVFIKGIYDEYVQLKEGRDDQEQEKNQEEEINVMKQIRDSISTLSKQIPPSEHDRIKNVFNKFNEDDIQQMKNGVEMDSDTILSKLISYE